MKSLTLLLAFSSLLFTVAAQESQKNIDLRINLKKNKRLEVSVRQKPDSNDITDKHYVFAITPTGRNKDGNYIADCRLIKVMINESEKDRRQILNSDSIKNNDINRSVALLPLAILNKSFEVEIDPTGNVTQIKGLQELLDRSLLKWQVEESTIAPFKRSFEEEVKNIFLASSGLSYNASPLEKKNLVLDSNWIDMSIQTGYLSKAMTSGGQLDSTKIYSILQKYDHLFLNDKRYGLITLNAVQQIGSDNFSHMYFSRLVNTPNKWLQNSDAHLHNKLSRLLDKRDVDGCYELSQYFYTSELFVEWLHNTLAQYLNRGDHNQPWGSLKEDSYKLLRLFHTDKDKRYQNTTTPMNLWATLRATPSDEALLSSTVKAFIDMSDEQMLQGNGGRYALLVYNIIDLAGKTKEREELLLSTIKKLKGYSTDTLNAYRQESKNMLAFAYGLKYKSAVQSGDKSAIEYLSKAAEVYAQNTNREVSRQL
jgi:hypothetical protein